ncbi:MAG: hypothetical protein DMF47_06980 [Verrucomicrobia bacterium]|nr:MAG: hypothetical protein DMF47_06980 [Verrucomicrobiota bacterium]
MGKRRARLPLRVQIGLCGFGIVTKDKQFLKSDAQGNKEIVEALKASGKKDHLRVDVTGDVQGDTLKVTSIKLL